MKKIDYEYFKIFPPYNEYGFYMDLRKCLRLDWHRQNDLPVEYIPYFRENVASVIGRALYEEN